MTRYFIFLILGFLDISTSAQTLQKAPIGITEFSCSNKQDKGVAQQLNEIIANEFIKSNRFIVVDRTKFNLVKEERELQKSEDFIDSEVIAQGKLLGAKYILTGNIGNIANSDTYNPTYQQYIYTTKIMVSIKVIDVETNQVISAETFGRAKENTFYTNSLTQNCNGEGIGRSTAQAIQSALSTFSCGVKAWIKRAFPLEVSVLSLEETSGNKAKKVLIAGGKSLGLSRGQELAVYEFSTLNIEGKNVVRKKQIGILRVLLIEDENFTTCTVLEGPVTIYEKFTQKTPLFVIIN